MSVFPPRSAFVFALLFLLILLFFMRGGWYERGELVIRGTAADTDAVIDARWDSGAGLNDYEHRRFTFLPFRGGADRHFDIEVMRRAADSAAPYRNRVILGELRVDGSWVYIPDSALADVRPIPGHGWQLSSERSAIRLRVPATQRISLLFKTSWNGGQVGIAINGRQEWRDLHRDNWEVLFTRADYWLLDGDGTFTLSFRLPRYRIESLNLSGGDGASFTSVELKSGSGATVLPFVDDGDGRVSISAPNRSLKRYVHPFHAALQAVAALLATWLVWILHRFVQRCGGLRQALAGRGRRLFWVLLGMTSTVYGLWLLAFWPGVMSVDSLNIWRAAVLPDVRLANHPYVNELWYLALSFIWQDPAVVPIVHILLVSVLIAAVFFGALRLGAPLWLLLPCWLLVVGSIPVGLYNVTLWKDVPFALLVVFWGLVPVFAYCRKRAGRPVGFSWGGAVLLLLSFGALLTVRYNGLVYLVVIPLLVLSLRLVRIPRPVLVISILAGAGVLYLSFFPPAGLTGTSYFRDFSRIYLEQLRDESVPSRFAGAAAAYPRILDIKKHEEDSDFWHSYLGDRYAYPFLLDVGWYDVYPYLPPDDHPVPGLRDAALQLYEASLEYPWLYLSWYPFFLLYLFPLCIVLFRRLPLAAVFSTVVLVQILALLIFVGTTNWRYYYFALLGGWFLLPVLLVDLYGRKRETPV